jgi:flagellar basal-body rod protein FlgC
MGMFDVFSTTGSALNAQSVRLNTVASNLANADSVSGDPETAYRARMPVFKTVLDASGNPESARVAVGEIVESQAEAPREYAPQHPEADGDGYIYRSNVNVVEQMADMTSASRTYQSNVEVVSSVKRLMLATLRLGQQ